METLIITLLSIFIPILYWFTSILISFNRYLNMIKLQKLIENQLIKQMKQLKRDNFINDYRFDGWKNDENCTCTITIQPKKMFEYIDFGFVINHKPVINIEER